MRRLSITMVIVFLLGAVMSALAPSAEASDLERVVLTVKAAPDSEFHSQIEFKHYQAMERAIANGREHPLEHPPISDIYLTLERESGDVTYVVEASGDLYDSRSQRLIELDRKIKFVLLSYADKLRTLHYGQLEHWDQVTQQLPNKTIIRVTDLETGLSFVAQKRAGKHHADVQPLTRQDTAIMKKIYNGKWSWNRRAVLVECNGRRIAASMNGKPHGGDGIPENNFSGHFCIHFLGSTTHGSGLVDPMHQMMVYKSAGKLEQYFATASPYQVAEAFFLAINMNEPLILTMAFTHSGNEELLYYLEERSKISSMEGKLLGERKDESGLQSITLPYDVSIVRGKRREKVRLTFHLERIAPSDPWKIEHIEN